MKKRIILLIAGSLAVFTSCKKELIEKSYDFLVPSSFYKTEADANAAIIGVYNTLLSNGFYGNFWQYENDSDHASGPSWFFGHTGQGNFLGFWGTDTPWNDRYVMISRTNSVLENVGGMNISEDVKQRVLGEAYFFRAFAYFDLVRLYGGVPLHLHTVASGVEPASMPRASVTEVYAQIIADLKQAETMLFPYKDPKSGGLGHVTKDGASLLLAKAYATMASGALNGVTIYVWTERIADGDNRSYANYPFVKKVVAGLEGVNSEEYFKLAMEKSAEVIATSGRTLFPSFMDNFKLSNKHREENMLMAEFFGASLTEGALVQVYSGFQLYGPATGGGWCWATKAFYNNYLNEGIKQDERALYGINHRPDILGKFYFPQQDLEYATDGYSWRKEEDKAYTTKYDDVAQKVLGAGNARYPIMRLADAYLINAEANNELGHSGDAYTSLNAIRRRAKTLDAPGGMNKDALRSFILEERGREFLFESNRRYDLLRWGIYLGVMNFMNVDRFNIVKARDNRSQLLPIPLSEINSNTTMEVNNPGW
ncbi:RagB/SusD family nutrient uptake outer membrane protein [Chitinophaga sp. MM2321]|uniref:RagB/SusD family nutrient uptake outer membrane protein n=1 Tax=Chitinophaga sp. MM2321 TaxID=3137178 RepID=UPI0032D5783B